MIEGSEKALRYWEDIRGTQPHTYGPLTISSELLDHLLELMGEKHPVHESHQFALGTSRRGRIVPGGFIHPFTSGWIVRETGPAAVVGLRSATWDFVRPIYPDCPFYFSNTTVDSSEVDESLGLVNTVRRVFAEDDRVYAIGRLSALIQRRPGRNTDPSEPSLKA